MPPGAEFRVQPLAAELGTEVSLVKHFGKFSKPEWSVLFRIQELEAGEMTQSLPELVLAKDPGSVPSTHMEAHNHM